MNNDDYLDVFTYTDLVGWSDKYVFFDSCNAEVLPNIPLHLTLSYADWTLGNVPVEGAVITINGEKTNFVTDADGKVEITFPEIGEYVVSAVSDTMTLVKPVYPVSVKESLVAYGDVDVDGDTDIIDVLKLNQYLLSLTELTEEGLKNADVDNNTLVNDADAISILKSLVGLVSLPVEAE